MSVYEASAVHVAAFVAAARELGYFEKAEPDLAPETRAVIADPYAKKWVSANVIQDLTVCIARRCGPESLEHLNLLMTRRSLGKLVLPMLKVALAITGRSPATVFSRLDDSVKVAMRGVTATWQPNGPNAGRVTLRYVEPMPDVVHHAWRGIFRFGFEITEREGRLIAHRSLEGRHVLELDVEWT